MVTSVNRADELVAAFRMAFRFSIVSDVIEPYVERLHPKLITIGAEMWR